MFSYMWDMNNQSHSTPNRTYQRHKTIISTIVPPCTRTEIFNEEEIEKMLKVDVIEPKYSDWATPIIFATTKCEALRFCVNYRRLSATNVRKSYPILRVDEFIDSLETADVFSTLCWNSGCWKMLIKESNRQKNAFSSHHGLYQITRMTFSLRNARTSSKNAINIILLSVRLK